MWKLIKIHFTKWLEKKTCCHNYVQYKHISHYEFDSDLLPYKHTDILICNKCGKIKKLNY